MQDIQEVRKQIKELQENNLKLTTKVIRNRKIIASKECLLQEVMDIAQESDSIDSDSTQASKKVKELPNGMDKVRELYKTVCQCGGQVKFNGFCQDCVQKMKEEFEQAYKNYLPVADEYEKQYSKNINLEVKMVQMSKKVKLMKMKIEKGDLVEMDMDLKLIRDEIDLLNKKIKVTQADIEIHKKEFVRYVEEKNILQQDLEQRVQKKEKKLKQVQKQLNELLKKNQEIEEQLKEKQEQLAEQTNI